jgi:threonyl-tRNA synthetase
MWDERFFYFVMKFEFNVPDTSGKASALSTVQIDVENTERFDISYVDETGTRNHPLLLHCSVSGSIDRNVYAFLEQEAMKIAKGGKGAFPFWLAPTQLRLIPVKDEFLPTCEKLAKSLPGVRVDVDDRDEGVSRKIRDAEKEWIPLILVYGEKEAASTKLPVRSRTEGQREYTIEELRGHIVKAQGEMPWMPLPVPSHLSKRPAFRG